MDRFTHCPEAFPIVGITAETIANAFVAVLVVRFGVPSIITTDREGQFESHLWQQLVRLLRTKRIWATAYYTIANGLIERFHCQLKVALKCRSVQERWTNSLPMVLLGVCTPLKNDLHCSTVKLVHVYGTTLHLPAKFFHSSGKAP